MSNKTRRNTVVKKIRQEVAFKKQKRTVVSACAELLAPLEIEIVKLEKKVKFWRNVTYGLLAALLIVLISVVKLFS